MRAYEKSTYYVGRWKPEYERWVDMLAGMNAGPGKNVDIVEQKLLRFVPKEFLQDVHHWLILHGRYTCKARKPECWNCIQQDLCDYRQKTPMPDGL